MSLISELSKKPWLPEPGGVADSPAGKTFPLPSEKLALRVFLCVVTVLFTLIIVVYSDRMTLPDWRPLQEPWLLWLNTGMLILASVAFQWALVSSRKGRMDNVRTGLHAAGVCTFAFFVGQLWVAKQLGEMGYFADSSPAVAFLYLMSGMHALHLFGGVVAWSRTASRVWRGQSAERVVLGVELCAIYWHYLLVLWLVLFGLLVTT